MDDMYRDDIANGGATFGPDPRYWANLVDEFNRANDLLPPTHPNGPRRPGQLPAWVYPGTVRFKQPKPPTERGWTERQCEFWDDNGAPDITREVDRTFENEVRPS